MKKENYVTKSVLKSVLKSELDYRIAKSENKLIGMMATMENRLGMRIDGIEVKLSEHKIETRELINEVGDLIMNRLDSLENKMSARFDGLTDIFVTKKELYGV